MPPASKPAAWGGRAVACRIVNSLSFDVGLRRWGSILEGESSLLGGDRLFRGGPGSRPMRTVAWRCKVLGVSGCGPVGVSRGVGIFVGEEVNKNIQDKSPR